MVTDVEWDDDALDNTPQDNEAAIALEHLECEDNKYNFLHLAKVMVLDVKKFDDDGMENILETRLE